MDWRKQGDVGVAAAIYWYTALGYTVAIPLGEASRYDVLIDSGQRIERVQCKTSTTRRPSGNWHVNLRTSGGNQSWSGEVRRISSKEVDLVFIWCQDGSLWEFPATELEDRVSVTLSAKYLHRRVQQAMRG